MNRVKKLEEKVDINKFTKEDLLTMAYFEPVTLFYNWNWMRERIAEPKKYGIDTFAFVHFDVKDFKVVNELYGHDVGDNLLRKVCDILDEQDWAYYCCRCDNDNFAMMVKKIPDDEIRARLEAMFKRMEFLDEDSSYPIYFRCGVASIDDVGAYGATITDLAKMAQNSGVKPNETEIKFYTDKMREEQLKGKMLQSDLDRALAAGEFIVYYQPKYRPSDNVLVGAEALIRWNYHHEGIIPPSEFIPYFEKEGVIGKLDRYVLESVCQRLEEWKREGYKLVPISVNMSRAQLYSPVLVRSIEDIVNKYDVDRKYIEFELTESLAYGDTVYLIQVMNNLREMGFMLSIDDFGTGYSSLNLLANMPLTTLKIDKSFIDGIGEDSNRRVNYIVRNILDTTKDLEISSIAEGVESETQKNLLRDWGVDSIQGFYYSKPIPVDQFEKLFSREDEKVEADA